MIYCARILLTCVFLFLFLCSICVSIATQPNDEVAQFSIIILQTNLILQSAANGNIHGELRVKWVLTSDSTDLIDCSAGVEPSLLMSCPEFKWDDMVLTGADSFPKAHCGGMFGTSLSLHADQLTPGLHILRLTLAECPASSCAPSPCFDIVSIHVHASAPATVPSFTIDDNRLKPGGIPRIFHRIWLSPPYLPPSPIPSTYQRYWQTWRRLHQPQGWRFVTWSESNLGRLEASQAALVTFNFLLLKKFLFKVYLNPATCTSLPCCATSAFAAVVTSCAHHLGFRQESMRKAVCPS
jgi:hypothetical protein